MIKDLIKIELELLKKDIPEAKIDSSIVKATSKALNYCHIKSIPEELNPVIADMALDLILNDSKAADDEEKVKSIQEGDTTITFESKTVKSSEDIIFKYTYELNSFRKPSGFR